MSTRNHRKNPSRASRAWLWSFIGAAVFLASCAAGPRIRWARPFGGGGGAVATLGQAPLAPEAAPLSPADAAAPPDQAAGFQPRVVFETSMGRIVCVLDEERAPNTVANFIGLVEGSRRWFDFHSGSWVEGRPFYDRLTFHRVVPGFLIQAGAPPGSVEGHPGYQNPDEFDPRLRHDRPGTLSMAPLWPASGPVPDSTGSQFFITLTAAPQLDGVCPAFGYVVEGMSVVERIGRVAVESDYRPAQPIAIHQARIERR